MYMSVMLNIRGSSVEKNWSNFYIVAEGAASLEQNGLNIFWQCCILGQVAKLCFRNMRSKSLHCTEQHSVSEDKRHDRNKINSKTKKLSFSYPLLPSRSISRRWKHLHSEEIRRNTGIFGNLWAESSSLKETLRNCQGPTTQNRRLNNRCVELHRTGGKIQHTWKQRSTHGR